jgi:sulfur-oxidizing protein SoxX
MTQCNFFAAMRYPVMLQSARDFLRPLRAGAALACALLAGAVGAQDIAEQGFRIMTSGTMGNCVACHALPGQTGVTSNFAPALKQVGARYSADELRQWVTDARLIKPDTLMPPFGTTQGTKEPIRAQSILSPDEIDHVVVALRTLR